MPGIRRYRPLFFILMILTALIVLIRSRNSVSSSNHAGHKTVIQNIGSDTMVNLAQAWAEEYAQVEPSVSVEVSGGGSGTGIAALINGTADICNSSRKMEPDEIARVKAATGAEPALNIAGHDGLAIFVNKQNPLDEITIKQLGEIYGEHGSVKSWADLGANIPACRDNKMILVSRQSNSGTYHYFREAVIGKQTDFRLGTLDLHGSKDVVELVSRTPCAIGYSGMGYATSHVKMLRVARAPGEQAYEPNVANTQAGTYPISRPLYLYTRAQVSPAVQNYLKWIETEPGQKIILASGYVPRTQTEVSSRGARSEQDSSWQTAPGN
jgi:phosphate transport system substrate-binding protein